MFFKQILIFKLSAFDSKMFFPGCEVSNGLICNPVLSNSFRFSNWYNGLAWWSGVEPHQAKSRDHSRWGLCHKRCLKYFLFIWHYDALAYFFLSLIPHFCPFTCFFLPRSCELCILRLTAYRCRFNLPGLSSLRCICAQEGRVKMSNVILVDQHFGYYKYVMIISNCSMMLKNIDYNDKKSTFCILFFSWG